MNIRNCAKCFKDLMMWVHPHRIIGFSCSLFISASAVAYGLSKEGYDYNKRDPIAIKAYLESVQQKLQLQREIFNLFSQENIDFYLKLVGKQALAQSNKNRCLAAEQAFAFYQRHQQKLAIKTQEIISYNIFQCYQRQNNDQKIYRYLHSYLGLVSAGSEPEKVKNAILSYSRVLDRSSSERDLESEFYFLQNLSVPETVENYKSFASIQIFFRLGRHEEAVKHLDVMVEAKKIDASDPKTIYLYALGESARNNYKDAYNRLSVGLGLVPDFDPQIGNIYRLTMARLLMLMKKPAKAEDFYSSVDFGNDPEISYERVAALIKSENYMKALRVAKSYEKSDFVSGASFRIRLLIPFLLANDGHYEEALKLCAENIATLRDIRQKVGEGINAKSFETIDAIIGNKPAWFVESTPPKVQLALTTFLKVLDLKSQIKKLKNRIDFTLVETARIREPLIYPILGKRTQSLRTTAQSVIADGQLLVDHLAEEKGISDPILLQRLETLKDRTAKLVSEKFYQGAGIGEDEKQFSSQKNINSFLLIGKKLQLLRAENAALYTHPGVYSQDKKEIVENRIAAIEGTLAKFLPEVSLGRILKLSLDRERSSDRRLFVLALDGIWQQWNALSSAKVQSHGSDDSNLGLQLSNYNRIFHIWKKVAGQLIDAYEDVESKSFNYKKNLAQSFKRTLDEYNSLEERMRAIEAVTSSRFDSDREWVKNEILKVIDGAIGRQIKWQGDIRYNLSSKAQEKMLNLSNWFEIKKDEIKEEEIRKKLWMQDLWFD